MANRQIYQLEAGTPSFDALLAFQKSDGSEDAKSMTVEQLQELAVPYKVYAFYAEQFSTNAPVVNVEQNTTGVTITWTRAAQGRIRGTASAAIFAANKTTVLLSGNAGDIDSPNVLIYKVVSTTIIDIANYDTTFVKQDSFNVSCEIKVYP